MKDELIKYETAVIAKEKGFDWNTSSHYNLAGLEFMDDMKNTEHDVFEYSAPTQSLLQRWLREEHCMYAYVDWERHQLIIYDMVNDDTLFRKDIVLNSDEQALQFIEEVIIEALKLIK